MSDAPLPVETLYDAIRERILSGAIAPGEMVRQDTLAGQLGVSKIPVREALARLASDGLLLSSPKKGFEATRLTAGQAREIFGLRLKIEPEAAATGARAAGHSDRLAALGALEALTTMTGAQPGRAASLSRSFHLALSRPGAGVITLGLVERLHDLAQRYVHATHDPSGQPGRMQVVYAELLRAWTSGHAEEVERRLADHLRGVRDDIVARLAA